MQTPRHRLNIQRLPPKIEIVGISVAFPVRVELSEHGESAKAVSTRIALVTKMLVMTRTTLRGQNSWMLSIIPDINVGPRLHRTFQSSLRRSTVKPSIDSTGMKRAVLPEVESKSASYILQHVDCDFSSGVSSPVQSSYFVERR